MDGVITLIAEGRTQKADGTWSDAPTGRQVLCKVLSVGRGEYYGAERAGHSPQYLFLVHECEYQGECAAEYGGHTFAIYRAFRRDSNVYVGKNLRERQELLTDYVELYAEKRTGAAGMLPAVPDSGGAADGGAVGN